MKRKTILFFLSCLAIGTATSCVGNGDDDESIIIIEPGDYPWFQFGDDGVPYSWGYPTLSQELQQDIKEQAIGYGWKWMQTKEISKGGDPMYGDYYERSIGKSPSSYYLESDDKLVRYFYSDSISAGAYLADRFTMDLSKGILYYADNPSAVSPWSFFFRIWGVWQLDGKWYMTTLEPLEVSSDERGDSVTVWGYSQYARMTQLEIKQMQETYTFDYSQLN